MVPDKQSQVDTSVTTTPRHSASFGDVKFMESEPRLDGKVELKDTDCWDKLGYSFPTAKKWTILTVIFIVQVSMNFNAGLYGNATAGLIEEFHISDQVSRIGQMIFLITYAFGCELWAPWSEQFGRWPILQLSLLFVNIWQIPCALAPNYTTIVVGRFLGGLSSAGGSVTLGMVADMWDEKDQQYAVAFIVLSSVGGSAIAPICGGFIQDHLNWRWCFWIQLIFGVVAQAIHYFVPETRSAVLVTREAKRRRAAGEKNIYSSEEIAEAKMTMKEVLTIWSRPFIMFATEPIVLCLSLLSGFSDALIFTFLESYSPVFKQWNFTPSETGLAFIPIELGYIVAYLSFIPVIKKQMKIRNRDPKALAPEARLWWLLYTVPLEALGLIGFAWTSQGPPTTHWIAPLIFSFFIGIANYAIYMATVDYMIAAYGPYSASATGGNGFARDFLAGVSAMYATPMFTQIPDHPLEYASTILAVVAAFVAIPVYLFYWYGPEIRAKSKFAQSLESDRLQRVQTLDKNRFSHIEHAA